MATNDDMREQILDVAQGLVQTLGYEGFSYADVSERVGIRKASIHHYFPRKSDLGVHLLRRFRLECLRQLGSLSGDAIGRLEGIVELFRTTLQSGRMCLCGILAAGFANLSDDVKSALLEAVSDQETWLARVIAEGQSEGLIRTDVAPEVLARNFLGGLEGALLLARIHDDPGRFESASSGLIEGIRSAGRS